MIMLKTALITRENWYENNKEKKWNCQKIMQLYFHLLHFWISDLIFHCVFEATLDHNQKLDRAKPNSFRVCSAERNHPYPFLKYLCTTQADIKDVI